MISRDDFKAEVLRAVGTPVVHMGRIPGMALDCVGLPWAACNALGLALPATNTYDGFPSEDALTDGLRSYCDEVSDPEDAHLWQVYVGRHARHIVVPISDNQCGQPLVVHAWGHGKKVCRTIYDRVVAKRWRIRGVE